jgi:hypothetical protein
LQYFWNNVKHNHYVQNFIKYNVDHWNHDTNEYSVPNDRYKALKMLPIERIVGNWKHNKPVGAAVIKYFNYEDYADKGVLGEYTVIYTGDSTTSQTILSDKYYYQMEIQSIIDKLKLVEHTKKDELTNLQYEIDNHVVPQVFIPDAKIATGFFASLFGLIGTVFVAAISGPFAFMTVPIAALASAAAVSKAIDNEKGDHYQNIAPEKDTVKLGYLKQKKDQTINDLRELNNNLKFISSLISTTPSRGGYNKFSKINKQRRRNISKINKQRRRNISKRIFK